MEKNNRLFDREISKKGEVIMSILGIGEAIGGVAQGAGNAALGAGMAAQGAGHAVSGIAQGAGIALAKIR